MDHEDGDGDGVVLAVMLMETPEGGWRRPPEVIPAAFPPSDILRRQPSVSLFLVSLVWWLSRKKTSGDLLYRRF